MNVLYLEDNEDDVRLVEEFLADDDVRITWTRNAAAARDALRDASFDAVLLDHQLPDTNSLLFLDELKANFPRVPVIVLTGREDDALAVSVHLKGADRLVEKRGMRERLRSSLFEVLDRRVVERDARTFVWPRRLSDRAEHLSRVLLSMMNEGCLLIDIEGVVTYANEAAEFMLGSAPNGLLGLRAADLFEPETARRFSFFFNRAVNTPGAMAEKSEGRLNTIDDSGTPREVFLSWRALHNELGQHEACLIVIADISELITTRNELRRRLAEVERFQRFFIEREHRVIELKAKLREYEKRAGIESPGLSEETRKEIERRLTWASGIQ